jgi:hypothetical protein
VWLWAAYANKIVEHETRYPRFIMGVAIITVVQFLLAFRIRSVTIRKWNKYGAGVVVLLLLINLIYTSDTRVNSVSPTERVKSYDVLQNLRAGRPELYSAANPRYFDLMEPATQQNVREIAACLRDERVQLATLVIFSPRINWPAILLSPASVRGDQFSGLLPGQLGLFTHVLLPMSYLVADPAALANFPASLEVIAAARRGKPICTAKDFLLLELPKITK